MSNCLYLDEHPEFSLQRLAFSSRFPSWKKIVANACVLVKKLRDFEKSCDKHQAPTSKESVFASENLKFIGFERQFCTLTASRCQRKDVWDNLDLTCRLLIVFRNSATIAFRRKDVTSRIPKGHPDLHLGNTWRR